MKSLSLSEVIILYHVADYWMLCHPAVCSWLCVFFLHVTIAQAPPKYIRLPVHSPCASVHACKPKDKYVTYYVSHAFLCHYLPLQVKQQDPGGLREQDGGSRCVHSCHSIISPNTVFKEPFKCMCFSVCVCRCYVVKDKPYLTPNVHLLPSVDQYSLACW